MASGEVPFTHVGCLQCAHYMLRRDRGQKGVSCPFLTLVHVFWSESPQKVSCAGDA